jgi:hypothetical protein
MRLSLTRRRNFADVFKTPGKLRGKTPRTARKRDALEQRQPLTDVFAPNLQAGPTPAKNTTFYEKVTRFQIAEDSGNVIPQQRVISRSKSPQRVGLPGNTDSGYHGMTEDEMEADNTQTDADTVPSQSLEVHSVPLRENQSPPRRLKDSSDAAEPASDESFMSAKEAVSHNASKEQLYPDFEEDNATVADEDMEISQVQRRRSPKKQLSQSRQSKNKNYTPKCRMILPRCRAQRNNLWHGRAVSHSLLCLLGSP